MPLPKMSVWRRVWTLMRQGYDPKFEDAHRRLEQLQEDLKKMDKR